jgi:hypothetical protein
LKQEDIDSKWIVGKSMALDGYSSTSLDRKVATFFAIKDSNNEMKSVLLKMKLKNETGKYHFSLDSNKYTCYPDEQEILL